MSARQADEANRAAVDWLLRLESAQAGSAGQQAFEHWLNADPEHAHAWQRVNTLLSTPLSALHEAERRSPGQLKVASDSLRSLPSPSRRRAVGGGLALLLGVVTAGVTQRITPLGGLLADQRTATGERRTLTLADGSRLSLDARTVVDILFDGLQRRVLLHQGAVQVDVAKDASRPFIVDSGDGTVRALGTQFMVRKDDGGSLASVQQHSVLLTNRAGRRQTIEAGQVFAFTEQGIDPQTPSWRSRVDWVEGRIDVRDEPLGQLIEALRPYRAGLLRVSPQAAQLRVYGVFALDDSDRTLRSLAETLPVQVNRHGFWLTTVDVRSASA